MDLYLNTSVGTSCDPSNLDSLGGGGELQEASALFWSTLPCMLSLLGASNLQATPIWRVLRTSLCVLLLQPAIASATDAICSLTAKERVMEEGELESWGKLVACNKEVFVAEYRPYVGYSRVLDAHFSSKAPFVPKGLNMDSSLNGHFRLIDGKLFEPDQFHRGGGIRINIKDPQYKQLVQRAQEAIDSWYPGLKTKLDESAGLEDFGYRSYITYHTDDQVRAVIALSAEASPMIKGAKWLTSADKIVVLVKTIRAKGVQKVIVEDEEGKRSTLRLPQLVRPHEYSNYTTEVVPGVISRYDVADTSDSFPFISSSDEETGILAKMSAYAPWNVFLPASNLVHSSPAKSDLKARFLAAIKFTVL